MSLLFHTYKRIFVIVLDSLGIGGASDAGRFGDEGADTFGHILECKRTLDIPNLARLGMLNLKSGGEMKAADHPIGRFAKLAETSNGKDTMCGHWEMMGIHTEVPFKTFGDTGFPPELISQLERELGREIIGNKAESGTVILDELAEQEVNDGKVIVYTSADSVLQICGNEDTSITGLDTLYRWCEYARKITLENDDWRVGRVIARPYTGYRKGEFTRTSNRRDYTLPPTGLTALDSLTEYGYDVIGVGKIRDIFSGQGITRSLHSTSSVHGMEQTTDIVRNDDFTGLCFVNLVDFDALWGHRRNVDGYAAEIEKFDVELGKLLPSLRNNDLLILTADHGNDPTYKGTDHTRENVPFIAYSPRWDNKPGGELPVQDSFAVIGATVCDNFSVEMPEGALGESLLKQLM